MLPTLFLAHHSSKFQIKDAHISNRESDWRRKQSMIWGGVFGVFTSLTRWLVAKLHFSVALSEDALVRVQHHTRWRVELNRSFTIELVSISRRFIRSNVYFDFQHRSKNIRDYEYAHIVPVLIVILRGSHTPLPAGEVGHLVGGGGIRGLKTIQKVLGRSVGGSAKV